MEYQLENRHDQEKLIKNDGNMLKKYFYLYACMPFKFYLDVPYMKIKIKPPMKE